MKRPFALVTFASLALGSSACTVMTDSLNDLLGLELGETEGEVYESDDWGEIMEDEKLDAGAPKLDVGIAEAEPSAVAPLVRAERPLPLPGRGATDMGFRVDTLASLYSLAGAMESPTWSAVGEGEPRRVRDNDLDTAWTCVPSGEDRCSIGIQFPTAAKVKAVRLFAASAQFEEYPRIKRVRVHTEAGFTDALLSDRNQHMFVQLAEDVQTRFVVLEVLEVYRGRAEEPRIHFGEMEFYGTEGVAREPLLVDPATTVAMLPERPWIKRGPTSYERAETFLHTVDADGKPHRMIEGSALRGRVGDRMLLIERIAAQSDCSSPRGTFFLLDTQTRMTAPLGDLGGVSGHAFRASDGNGIAIGYTGKIDTKLSGLFVEGKKYRRRQTPIRADQRLGDYFEEWGLDREPVPRMAAALNAQPAGCTIGSDDVLVQLAASKEAAQAAKGKGKRRRKRRRKSKTEEMRPGQWQVCELTDGARMLLTDHGPCGGSWEINVLDAEDVLVATQSGSAKGSFLRVAPHKTAGTYIVQVGRSSDAASVVLVTADAITEVTSSGSLGIQPPSACRDDCLAEFPNPHAPVWK